MQTIGIPTGPLPPLPRHRGPLPPRPHAVRAVRLRRPARLAIAFAACLTGFWVLYRFTRPSYIDKHYKRLLSTPSDISEHLTTIYALAKECTTAAEFGVRGGAGQGTMRSGTCRVAGGAAGGMGWGGGAGGVCVCVARTSTEQMVGLTATEEAA